MTLTQGRLHLCFDVPASTTMPRTRLTVRDQQPPLKVVRAFAQADGAALVHLHNVSGGVLAGDALVTEVHLAAGARVQLTSTSATRLYRQRGHRTATQRMHVTVAAGGLIEYVPDAIIPFASARVQQHTHIELGDDAGAIWWEMIAPGREAMGERFAYDLLELDMRIDACGQPIAIEHVLLRPGTQDMRSPARMAGFGHYATFYACRVGTDPTALEAALMDCAQALSQTGDERWGVSALPAHGVAVRGLAHTSRALQAGLMAFWQTAKQMLYGSAAIAPRKTY